MEKKTSQEAPSRGKVTAAFKVGAISFAFLVIGYQVALFIHSAAVSRIISNRDAPDTVYVVDDALARRLLGDDPALEPAYSSGDKSASRSTRREYVSHGSSERFSERRAVQHAKSSDAQKVYEKFVRRHVESFPFNPNTVSVEDLVRLGFSEKQAQAIDHYRQKGGRFHRKQDFAASYVVADSVFERLEPFIRIPLVDLNSADSAAFDALPGIGPYFAAKMVSHREELGGYSYKEQLMDIWHFDEEKFDGLKDLIKVDTTKAEPYRLWELSEKELSKHPYIGKYSAHGVVLYRDHTPKEQLSVEALGEAGVLPADQARKLARCRIARPLVQ